MGYLCILAAIWWRIQFLWHVKLFASDEMWTNENLLRFIYKHLFTWNDIQIDEDGRLSFVRRSRTPLVHVASFTLDIWATEFRLLELLKSAIAYLGSDSKIRRRAIAYDVGSPGICYIPIDGGSGRTFKGKHILLTISPMATSPQLHDTKIIFECNSGLRWFSLPSVKLWREFSG